MTSSSDLYRCSCCRYIGCGNSPRVGLGQFCPIVKGLVVIVRIGCTYLVEMGEKDVPPEFDLPLADITELTGPAIIEGPIIITNNKN